MRITKEIKEKIIELHQNNPEMTYCKIAKILGIQKNTARYYIDPEMKKLIRARVIKWRKTQHPLYRRIIGFCTDYGNHSGRKTYNKNKIIKLEDALNKFGENPKCYLTGESIDIYDLSSYSLDHIIPLCQGGQSTLENMGLCKKQANTSKNGMTPEQFYAFCIKVLEAQGYKITK